MQITRVTKVSNPRRHGATRRKRNLSLKQKLHFGSARQRTAAKAALKRKRSNPKRANARRTVKRVVRHRRANPAHILTLGLLNPRPSGHKSKRSKKRNMAATKKNTRRRRRSVASNPKRRRRNTIKVYNPRRRRRLASSNPRRHRRNTVRRVNARRHHRSRNPVLFGRQMGAFEVAKAIVGGLAGVAVTKAVPNMLPSVTTSSPTVAALTSLAVAVGAGMLVLSLVKDDPILGSAVMFGGLMQAGSVALNAFLPSVGTYIGLQGLGNGMGDLVAARFPVPMNPIMAGQAQLALPPPAVSPAAAHAAAGGAGIGAIYNPFGRAI